MGLREEWKKCKQDPGFAGLCQSKEEILSLVKWESSPGFQEGVNHNGSRLESDNLASSSRAYQYTKCTWEVISLKRNSRSKNHI